MLLQRCPCLKNDHGGYLQAETHTKAEQYHHHVEHFKQQRDLISDWEQEPFKCKHMDYGNSHISLIMLSYFICQRQFAVCEVLLLTSYI